MFSQFKKKIIVKSVKETKFLAKKMAEKILTNVFRRKGAFVLGLVGNFGSGKTTFTQGFARGLGIKKKIISPTFIIMKKFKTSVDLNFYHFDCYRIKTAKELLTLGIKEIFSNPKNVVIIEWPDSVKKIMPKNSVWINFLFVDKNQRIITIK